MDLMKWKSPRAPSGGVRGGLLARYPRERREADRAAVLDLLREVQIPNPGVAMDKLPYEFSGGQRQRIMIAMALLPEPDLIVADEPTTALDVTIQAQILRLLFQLVRDRSVSVLFTTHDLGTAYEICDRITVMYAGQEVESAPTAEFFRAAPPLYREAPREPAQPRGRHPGHPGRDPEPDRSAARLPLPHPLRARRRGLPASPTRGFERGPRASAPLPPPPSGSAAMITAEHPAPRERRQGPPPPLLEVRNLAKHFRIRGSRRSQRHLLRALDGVLVRGPA